MSKVAFLNIEESLYSEVVEAACNQRGFQEEIRNPDFDPQKEVSGDNPARITNPLTKEEFAAKVYLDMVKRDLVNHKASLAQVEAGKQVREEWKKVEL